MTTAPVITIDGPSGTGKGTIALMLQEALGWHMLDSGAIYRAIAWATLEKVVNPKDEKALVDLINRLEIKIIEPGSKLKSQVFCNEKDVTQLIRIEEVGMVASSISKFSGVRTAVLALQRSFRQFPGLITDGRDMGTVIFPDADLKIYLDASSEIRTERRYAQLRAKQIEVALEDVKQDLAQRDSQDSARAISPLKPAEDAYLIDTSHLTVDEVFVKVMTLVRENVL